MRLISKPVLCNYYVTYRCNASCGFCDIWEKPSPYITLENAEANFRDLKRLGVRVIDFTGGEPLLHREIDQLVRRAKAYGFITTITTNGLLYPKWAKRLAGNVDMLHFSLDSIDEARHNASRNVACFQHVFDSIELAKSLGERPDILFTVTSDNIGELEEAYQEICVKHNLVLILNPIFDYPGIGKQPQFNPADFVILRKFARKRNVYLNEGFLKLREDGGNDPKDPICKAGSSCIVISPENNLVVPCYHLGTKEFPIQNDLLTRYHTPEVQQMVAMEGRLPECEGCVINCYMQPSFAVEINKYWWHALPSTLKYNRMKGTWKQLLPSL